MCKRNPVDFQSKPRTPRLLVGYMRTGYILSREAPPKVQRKMYLQFQRALRSQVPALLRGPCRIGKYPQGRAAFSTSGRRDIMGMTGFTEEQLTVREAISHICSKIPNTYWQERDQQEKDPKEFHAALAKDGWLGIALPESLGGAGLGTVAQISYSHPDF